MNIVFTYFCAVFYNCHQPVGFLKHGEFLDWWSSHNGVRKNRSPWRLFVSRVFGLFMYKIQTNGCYQFFAVQNAYNRCILFHAMREGSHDLCGGVCYRTVWVLWKVKLATCDVHGTEEVSINVEEAIDIKEEIPEAVSCPPIKTEYEVKLWGVCEVLAAHGFRAFIAPQKIKL
jgi:hypothetical protein